MTERAALLRDATDDLIETVLLASRIRAATAENAWARPRRPGSRCEPPTADSLKKRSRAAA